MIRSLKWVGDLFFHNILWKLLSLAIAVVIWALVATEPELSTFASVRLEYKNLPEGMEISSEPVSSVMLELRGPAGALRTLTDGTHPDVIVDMAGTGSGQHTFTLSSRNVKLMRGVRLVRAIPSEVRFNFEPRRSATVPVRLRFINEGQSGYVLDQRHVDPEEMEIIGPRSRVARIAEVTADPIDLATVAGPREFHVNVFAEDPFVRFVNIPEATVTVTMKRK